MKALQLNQVPYYNADPFAPGVLSPEDVSNLVYDIIPDGRLISQRRPGLKLFTNLQTNQPGDGLFYWRAVDRLIAVSGGKVFRVNSGGGFVDFTDDALAIGTPATFADGQALDGTPWLYIANGKLVYTFQPADTGVPIRTKYPSGAGVPDTATHVAYINNRFLANFAGTAKFGFTDTRPATGLLDNTFWGSSDAPASCDAKGDILKSLRVFSQEIHAWGQEGMETWVDDGVTPFSPLTTAFVNAGLLATYSVAHVDNTSFALCEIDQKKVVVRIDGRTPRIISLPIEQILASYAATHDAVGQCISVDGRALYLLQFPTEGKTWCYDFKHDVWSPWGSWVLGTGVQAAFQGMHSCYVTTWNKHLIMSTSGSQIYELDPTSFEDIGGRPIKAWLRTPWDDGGTPYRKRCRNLFIKLRRGSSTSGALFVRYADDGDDVWSNHIEVPLIPRGDRDFIVSLGPMGIYESRRYEFAISDDCDFTLISAAEDTIPLRY